MARIPLYFVATALLALLALFGFSGVSLADVKTNIISGSTADKPVTNPLSATSITSTKKKSTPPVDVNTERQQGRLTLMTMGNFHRYIQLEN